MEKVSIKNICRSWSFYSDMNHDGLTTISDVWLWVKWLYFYPGDWLINLIISNDKDMTIFFELTNASYGGSGSAVISMVTWFVAFTTFIFVNEITKNGIKLETSLRLFWAFGSVAWAYYILEFWQVTWPVSMEVMLIWPILIAWIILFILLAFISKKNEMENWNE